jgi:hypothetical protein
MPRRVACLGRAGFGWPAPILNRAFNDKGMEIQIFEYDKWPADKPIFHPHCNTDLRAYNFEDLYFC